MIDRTTKILLVAITLGLWANVLAPVVRPTPANADNSEFYLVTIESHLRDLSGIKNDLSVIRSDIDGLSSGICLNSKLC